MKETVEQEKVRGRTNKDKPAGSQALKPDQRTWWLGSTTSQQRALNVCMDSRDMWNSITGQKKCLAEKSPGQNGVGKVVRGSIKFACPTRSPAGAATFGKK